MPDIDLNTIRLDPNNVRIASAGKDEDDAMLTSIQQHGVLMPILVRPDPEGHVAYMVVAGNRRWQAAKTLGLPTIPAEVREFASEADVTLAQIEENEVRADMKEVDVWGAVEKAARTLPTATIAVKMGLDERTVRRFVRMGELSEKVKAYIRSVGDDDDLPSETHLAKIVGATHERQDQVLEAQLAQNRGVVWWQFAQVHQ